MASVGLGIGQRGRGPISGGPRREFVASTIAAMTTTMRTTSTAFMASSLPTDGRGEATADNDARQSLCVGRGAGLVPCFVPKETRYEALSKLCVAITLNAEDSLRSV